MRNNFVGEGSGEERECRRGRGARGAQRAVDLFYSQDYSFTPSPINQFKSYNHSHMKPPSKNQKEESPVRRGCWAVAAKGGSSKLQKMLSAWREAKASQEGRTLDRRHPMNRSHSMTTTAAAYPLRQSQNYVDKATQVFHLLNSSAASQVAFSTVAKHLEAVD